jgi:hypothetical protein
VAKSSESRKSNVETRLILPKNGRTQRRIQKANSTKLVRRKFLHLGSGRCRAPGHVADRRGASLSYSAYHHDRGAAPRM